MNDHEKAINQLHGGFTCTAGVIRPKPGYAPTAEDFAAIEYLCDEWDYGYELEAEK